MTTGRRRPLKKPKGKEGFCWAWKNGQKARGLVDENRGDREAAETHRCHRKPDTDTGRCYLHGGTAKSGKDHHSDRHGFYSKYYQGILATAGEAQESLQAAASSLEELALQRVLIGHKLGEINVAGPSDEAWSELKGMVRQIRTETPVCGLREKQAAAGPPPGPPKECVPNTSGCPAARRRAGRHRCTWVIDRWGKNHERDRPYADLTDDQLPWGIVVGAVVPRRSIPSVRFNGDPQGGIL